MDGQTDLDADAQGSDSEANAQGGDQNTFQNDLEATILPSENNSNPEKDLIGLTTLVWLADAPLSNARKGRSCYERFRFILINHLEFRVLWDRNIHWAKHMQIPKHLRVEKVMIINGLGGRAKTTQDLLCDLSFQDTQKRTKRIVFKLLPPTIAWYASLMRLRPKEPFLLWLKPLDDFYLGRSDISSTFAQQEWSSLR